MSKRTERRAAERETRKLAYQQFRQTGVQQTAPGIAAAVANPPAAEPEAVLLARAQAFFEAKPLATEPQTPSVSEAQLAANRANARLSSGPKSSAGKAKSSLNALSHGLTSKTVVMAGEDTAEYTRLLTSYTNRHAPANEDELRLVQSMVDGAWRLNRMTRLESAIYLKGTIEFADKFADRSPVERPALIEIETYLKYEKSLRNLNLQEARLRRTFDKDCAELQRLQTIRQRGQHLSAEAQASKDPKPTLQPVRPENGFDFSTPPNRPPASQTHISNRDASVNTGSAD
jgi:hypothetical protein